MDSKAGDTGGIRGQCRTSPGDLQTTLSRSNLTKRSFFPCPPPLVVGTLGRKSIARPNSTEFDREGLTVVGHDCRVEPPIREHSRRGSHSVNPFKRVSNLTR
jgi:hypothetical protein